MPDSPVILLVDNGSLQPMATLNLRCLAAGLEVRVGARVEPVSLLHSSAIDPARLGGIPAEILEPALRRRYSAERRKFVLVPLFFGPSAALTEYIPERVRALTADLPGLDVRVAAPVVDPARPGDSRLASILAEHVRGTAAARSIERPWVILVDHGSPQRAVAAVRDAVAADLARQLGGTASSVIAASMERRDGADYAFNEPLLARALERVSGPGVVALMFFSPGRHAGPGGDIEAICAEAARSRPGLQVHLTPLVGEHSRLIEILADRLRAAVAS
ncbi:MAG: cobalamin biosynthesis protein CbiX [Opitutaceae bacterium]|nr:cobalamin biosynthesis protein CbiX [Opitutaceae bacterium]